jgi:tRNA(Ile)-lysidine synthetase-like protein
MNVNAIKFDFLILNYNKLNIHNKMQELLDFWFPFVKQKAIASNYQSFWFDGSLDNVIKDKFYDLLIRYESDYKSEVNKLGVIILFDQITRNIFRNTEDAYRNDEKAFELAMSLIESNQDILYPLYQRIFILLPLRHRAKQTNNRELLDLCIERINMNYDASEKSILKKFLQATYKNYGDLNDYELINESSDTKPLDILIKYSNYLDSRCLEFNFEKNEIIYNKLETVMKDFIQKRSIRNIGISLSGGVDSMVISHICKKMRDLRYLDHIYAVHISYSNRDEMVYETNMVIDWCKSLNIPLIIKRINYMRRDSVDREFYEMETRRVRFNLYRHTQNKFGVYGFCLGHHFGDLAENVMTNVLKGRDLLDLFVMEEQSIIDSTIIYRPFINNLKSDIFDYAEINKVLYTKDTTPNWSCRGVMRRKVFPILEDQFGSGVYNNLSNIGKMSNSWNKIIKKMIIEPFLKKIKYTQIGLYFEMDNTLLELPEVFWMKIFIHIFHNAGIKMISFKNLQNLLLRMNNFCTSKKNNQTMISLSNKCIFAMDISRIYIFYNYKTSWNKTIVDRESIIKKNTLLDVINGEYSINICDTDRYLEGNRKNKINKQISEIRLLGNFIELPNDKEIIIYKDKKIIYN